MGNSNAPKKVKGEIQRLQILLDAARLLNSTLELNELTRIILEVVRSEVPVERVTVFVVDRARKTLHSLVAQEVQDFEITLEMGSGIAGTVAATGEILDIPDAYADPRFNKSFDRTLEYHTGDIFAVPVFNRHGDIVGVLELLNRLRPIGQADREFLLGISVYIGLALENAWLHAQVVAKERLEEELVTLRDRLAQMERLSLMSHVFDDIVHEINNPLTFAMGYAELARHETGQDSKVWNYLKKIESGIDRTATTLRKFQAFIQRQKRELTPVDLRGAIQKVCALRSPEWNRNKIEGDIELEGAPQVFAHEGQMLLVLMYLIKNAEDAILRSGSGGRLRIHLSSSEDHVRIDVQDSGAGIAPDIQSRVFQPFFTTKVKGGGTGLGLSIVHSIIQQHKGQIRFESESGSTKFTVELPVHTEELVPHS